MPAKRRKRGGDAAPPVAPPDFPEPRTTLTSKVGTSKGEERREDGNLNVAARMFAQDVYRANAMKALLQQDGRVGRVTHEACLVMSAACALVLGELVGRAAPHAAAARVAGGTKLRPESVRAALDAGSDGVFDFLEPVLARYVGTGASAASTTTSRKRPMSRSRGRTRTRNKETTLQTQSSAPPTGGGAVLDEAPSAMFPELDQTREYGSDDDYD